MIGAAGVVANLQGPISIQQPSQRMKRERFDVEGADRIDNDRFLRSLAFLSLAVRARELTAVR